MADRSLSILNILNNMNAVDLEAKKPDQATSDPTVKWNISSGIIWSTR